MKQKIFIFLVEIIYKIFNVIERNDIVIQKSKYKSERRLMRVLDIDSYGRFYFINDSLLTPMREGPYPIYRFRLKKKFFKNQGDDFRPKDNGWRRDGKGGFKNIFNKEKLNCG